jgi:hypothetical protein
VTRREEPTEYRVAITFASGDTSEAAVERVFRAFYETHREVEAVVGATERTLDVTFSFPAVGAYEALERGWEIFREAGAAAGLPTALAVTHMELDAVAADELQQASQPVS